MATTTSTLQTTYSRHQHCQRTEQNELTLPADRNWPITTDERYLSLTANNITAKQTNQFSRTRLITFDWQTTLSLDSEDDFRSGCRNVSHCHRQQSFSGLLSPGRSHYTIDIFYIHSKASFTGLRTSERDEITLQAPINIIYWFILQKNQQKFSKCLYHVVALLLHESRKCSGNGTI